MASSSVAPRQRRALDGADGAGSEVRFGGVAEKRTVARLKRTRTIGIGTECTLLTGTGTKYSQPSASKTTTVTAVQPLPFLPMRWDLGRGPGATACAAALASLCP